VEVKKIIIIDDCMSCPVFKGCATWKKLTPQQRFKLTVGVGVGKFILKGCKLEDYKDAQERMV
jgi:hypothetical protein